MITVYWDVVQGSEAWHKAREHKFTGSNAYKLLKYGAIDYARTVQTDFSGSHATRRGHALEPQSIEIYEAIKKVKVDRPGYIINDGFPDCLYSPDGLTEQFLIESKSYNETDHTSMYKGEIPFTIMAQVQFGMMICEKPYAHLLLYNPDLEAKLAFKIIEIKYNPKIGNNFKRILSGASQVCAQPT